MVTPSQLKRSRTNSPAGMVASPSAPTAADVHKVISQLREIGCDATEHQAQYSLTQTKNNADEAVNWYLDNAHKIPPAGM